MESKKAWLSKTLWVNALVAISALFVPEVKAWIEGNPEAVVFAMSLVNMGLRMLTQGKLELV